MTYATDPVAGAVQVLRKADLPLVVDLHLEAFPGSFLSQLGPGFLLRFYSALAESQNAILVCIREGRKLVGFVAGSTARGFVQEFVRKTLPHIWRYMPRIIGELLRHPALFHAGGRLLFRRSDPPATGAGGDVAELFSLAVARRHQRRGVGRQLLEAFETRARDAGASKVVLGARAENQDVIAFYVANGFVPLRTGTNSRGEPTAILTKDVGRT